MSTVPVKRQAQLLSLLLPVQRALYVGANIFLLVLGASIVLRTPGVAGFSRRETMV